jgi:CBS domain containing-hemolysin-like protein
MARDFHSLELRALRVGATICRPAQTHAAHVTLESPALHVMTDLRQVSPAIIGPGSFVEGANQYMIFRRVRLLLVVDEKEGVIGVITANDILGERPRLVAAERGLRYNEITVADIMTDGEMGALVRGIFSLSQIARQLGITLQTSEVARTFAEIEAAIGR